MDTMRRESGKAADFSFDSCVFPVLSDGEPVGTGFSIKDGGLVATAAHILKGKESIGVRHGFLGRDVEVDGVFVHPQADFALLFVSDREMRGVNPFQLGCHRVWREFQLPYHLSTHPEIRAPHPDNLQPLLQAHGNLSGFLADPGEIDKYIRLQQSVYIGDDLETYGYFTNSDREPVHGRLLKGSVLRKFTAEGGIYNQKAERLNVVSITL